MGEEALEAATEVEAEVPETEWRAGTCKVDAGEDLGQEAKKTAKS